MSVIHWKYAKAKATEKRAIKHPGGAVEKVVAFTPPHDCPGEECEVAFSADIERAAEMGVDIERRRAILSDV